MDVASATWVYHSRKVAFLPDHASHQSFLLTSASLIWRNCTNPHGTPAAAYSMCKDESHAVLVLDISLQAAGIGASRGKSLAQVQHVA